MSKLTKAQRGRLEKLAAYLEGLPRNYRHFDMGDYTGLCPDDRAVIEYARKNGGVPCGTVACALGHGPAAGILVPSRFIHRDECGDRVVHWGDYGALFGMASTLRTDPVYFWAFSDDWKPADNHHWGAAARIRYLLDHGKPPERWAYDNGTKRLYAPYRIDAKAKVSA